MINETNYLSKINDTYFFADNLIGIALDKKSSQLMIDRLSDGSLELMNNPRFWDSKMTEEDIRRGAEIVYKKIYSSNADKVNNYRKWILNYSLVMLCSIFDSFQEDLIVNVLDANKKFCSWDTKELIIERFKHNNIKEKLSVFINKLQFTENQLFDFSIFDQKVQDKLKNVDKKYFINIYKKRDRAAHTDIYILHRLEELQIIKSIFEKLIINWVYIFRQKWNIKSAMVELFHSQQLQ